MLLPRSSKEKSARLDWGYVHRSSGLARLRHWLWLLTAVLVAGPLAAATLSAALTGGPAKPLALAASRGPVASPHAAWEDRCEACHTPFAEIGSDRWFGSFTGHAEMEKGHNLRCEQCHAAPAHQANVKPEAVAGCADCHREHQGRTASLTRLADSVCIRCHAGLKEHQLKPTEDVATKQATAFARPDGHPEFRPVDPTRVRAPRSLRFSHATHMAAGLDSSFDFTKIRNETERERYVKQLGQTDPKALVQLDCKACHQLEVDGRTYKPATFELNCRACHPLTFDDSPALREAQAPHHVQPAEIEKFLRMLYTERFVNGGIQPGREPDRGPGRLDPPPHVVAAAKGKIDAAVTAAMQTLLVGRTTCLECHEAEPGPGRIPAKIKPILVPAKWLPRARFDHTAHRAMACQACHQQAMASKADEGKAASAWSGSKDADAVYQHRPDLPDAANCRQCHSPAGGVRHGCTDCHPYHGSGSKAPAQPFDHPAEWLRGR